LEACKTGTQKKYENWRHPQIRDGLRAETTGRCAYCEGVVADVAYPNVEHIIPKAVHPELAHRWPNLTWACPACNGAKGDYYHPDLPVLNPYEDDIQAHLAFPGGLASHNLGAIRGELTVKQLKLNRYDLVNSRVDRLTKVLEMVERWNEADGQRREALAIGIRLDAAEGEFTAAVFQYLEYLGFPI
jgi:hypothetical protein